MYMKVVACKETLTCNYVVCLTSVIFVICDPHVLIILLFGYIRQMFSAITLTDKVTIR